jgi:hypothetical protein
MAPRNPAAKNALATRQSNHINPPTILSLLQTYPVAVEFSVSNAPIRARGEVWFNHFY